MYEYYGLDFSEYLVNLEKNFNYFYERASDKQAGQGQEAANNYGHSFGNRMKSRSGVVGGSQDIGYDDNENSDRMEAVESSFSSLSLSSRYCITEVPVWVREFLQSSESCLGRELPSMLATQSLSTFELLLILCWENTDTKGT